MKNILKSLALLLLPSLALAGVHIQQGDTNVQLGYVNVSSLTCSGSPCGTGSGGSGGIVSPGTFTWVNNLGISISTQSVSTSTVKTNLLVGTTFQSLSNGSYATEQIGNNAVNGSLSIFMPSVTSQIYFAPESGQPTMIFRRHDDSAYEVGQFDTSGDYQFLGNGTCAAFMQVNNGAEGLRVGTGGCGGNPRGVLDAEDNGTNGVGLYISETSGYGIIDQGQVQINSSMTVTGAGGLGVTYGVVVGSLTCTGSPCGSGGGGGSSSLAVLVNSVQISSPTSSVGFVGPQVTSTNSGSSTTITIAGYLAGVTSCLTINNTVNPPTVDINTGCVAQLTASNNWTGTNTFSNTIFASSSVVVSGPGNGGITLTISGSTYSVISSSISPSSFGQFLMFSSTNGTVIGGTPSGGNPGGTAGQLQYNSGSSFAGSASVVTTSSITILSSMSITNNGVQNPTPGLVDIYSGNASSGGGQNLLSIGSVQQTNQIVIQDQTALGLTRYGANIGSLSVGLVSPNNHRIFDANSATQYVDYWNGGTMRLQTTTTGNGGQNIVLSPNTVDQVFVSSLGVTFIAPSTANQDVSFSTYTTGFHVKISTNGDIISNSSSTNMGSCGTTPSVIGDNNDGIITVGSGVTTACTMNFANGGWGTGCNVSCEESDNSTAVTGDVSALSPTSVTFSFSATLGSGLIYYNCRGYGSACK